ncbi:PAS domain S-box protein [Bacillus luteolus]|uniref:PAS domain S-box protein n=1 Tax=Litchfieldia luteola TaxID=682179 RepID=A0ABR9QD88_9BACI|nr:PAS domain S-box protein [Cytobacillus luteolus]MBE4906459.1 PAS domain S-box protein [Cytobacillus luteolus]MBP1941247.1 diguanylate cyclase (GGDEF)-like protein/PAS domain S-box-containing protein [Cytobacillus luteolus]
MAIDLLNNLAITAALLFIAGKFFENKPLDLDATLKTRLYGGLWAGILGSLLMLSTIQVTETVILDLRHLAIVIVAVYGGPVSAIVAGIIIGSMRILLFGINNASIVGCSIAIIMGGIIGYIATFNMRKIYKYILMNSAFVITNSIALTILIANLAVSQKTLLYYIPISIVGGLFSYSIVEYIRKSNVNQRNMKYYKMMADNSTDIISTHNIDGTFKFLSPSCETILGYNQKELIGKTPTEFHLSEDFNKVTESHKTVSNSLSPYTVEYRFKRKDGTIIWLETTSKQMTDSPSSQKEIICLSRDITERKVIEDALKENKERFSNLVKHMPNPMIVHKDNKIIFANEQASKLGKYSVDELVGKSIFDFIQTEYHPKTIDHIKGLYEGKHDPNTLEFKMKTSTGRYLDIEATSKYIRYNNEGAIQVIFRDVTEKTRLERELKETHDRFTFITENSKDVITILEGDGVVRYISPACEKLFGYTVTEFVGKNVFQYIHPDDIGEIMSLQQQFANLQKEFVSITYRYQTKNKDYIWLETVAKAVRNDNQLESILLVTRDITSRQEQAIALEESNQMLQRLSMLDGLTEIPNRRYFDIKLAEEWNNSKRTRIPISIILLDIDYFKKYNDEYGHLEGDDCLRRVASLLTTTLKRPRDFVARYGGEEFVVILPETDVDGAMTVAEHLRSNIRAENIPHKKSKIDHNVTVSLGCATVIGTEMDTPEELVEMADKALYKSKQTGRNCVTQFTEHSKIGV